MEGTKCKRLHVIAFGADKNKTGFSENKNYTENGCTGEKGNCGCTHAEINLLKKIPNLNIIFITHSPCLNCAKALVEANVKKVRFVNDYRDNSGVKFLLNNLVEVQQIDDELFNFLLCNIIG